ncbi:MAG: ligase-associated DNA damage response exonuclease [Desulfobacterales bacterium]|jgi:putative mRNA 3-end processing factor
MRATEFLQLTSSGLFCPMGDFFIDPWHPVEKALITHGHADHTCRGCHKYLAAKSGEKILRRRLGSDIELQTLRYGERIYQNGVAISLHPAGHILGSAQVRIEYKGRIWVVSGDYKVEPDPTCAPFEIIRCHTFITESTFGLPIFSWPSQREIFDDINAWWRTNSQQQRSSILFAYALGKAQRVLAGLDNAIGPILTHGAVENFTQCFRESGISLPPTQYVGEVADKRRFQKALIVAPPSADSVVWTKKFSNTSKAFASGWMQIRGYRRRRTVDRGFVLSDHSDWDGLIGTIEATGAETIWVTHGYSSELVRWLQEHGLNAQAVPTRYSGEINDTQDSRL